MTTDRWINCALDEEGVQLLQDWKLDLQGVEESCLALEVTLAEKLAELTATEKVKATCTFGTQATLNRLILTSVEGGTDIHSLTIFLANPGPTANYNLFVPSTYKPTITDYRSDGMDLLYVNLGTDTNGNVVTGPRALANEFTAQGYDDEFTSATPDFYVWWIFVFDFPLPSNTQEVFAGGNDAALANVIKSLNTLYRGTGKDYESLLTQAGIPVAKEGDTAAEVLSQISDLLILVSGKRLLRSGQNLLVLRELWTLFGSDDDATTKVLGLLPGTDGMPNVVWVKTVTTTVNLPACDGGGSQTTSTTEVDSINQKPSSTVTCTPTVWWTKEIEPSVGSLALLSKYGLSNTQIQDALDSSKDTTRIIIEPTLVSTLGLSSADFTELMNLSDVEGVQSTELSMEEALDELSKSAATIANGFISATFNMPGEDLRSSLSPEVSMTSEIQAFNDSKCIDPFGKGVVTSLIAAASAMIDSVLRIVERVKDMVKSVLNKVSAVLSNLQSILSKLNVVACLLGEDISLDGPTLDLMAPQVESLSVSLEGALDPLQAIMEEVMPVICKITEAIQSILGPIAGKAECLKIGITNDLFNKFGTEVLKLIPCIENPFDVIGMLEDVINKALSVQGMVFGLLDDVLKLVAQVNAISTFSAQAPAEAATSGCQSPVLGAMVSSIKSKFV